MACAPARPVYERGGERYGVVPGGLRPAWHGAYLRGLSYARGGYLDDAVTDLLASVRNGPPDQWRAAQMGLHLGPYFPRRELGIVYFRQGRTADAAKLLSESLAQMPTARASHHLIAAWRQQAARGEGQCPMQCGLKIAAPANGAVQKSLATAVQVHAEAAPGVAAVEVLAETGAVLASHVPPLPAQAVTTTLTFTLPPGTHKLTAKARSHGGTVMTQPLALTADPSAPFLCVTRPVALDRGLRLEIVAHDAGGLQALTIDGSERPAHGVTEMRVPLDIPRGRETHAVKAVALNRAGHSAEKLFAPGDLAAVAPNPGHPRLLFGEGLTAAKYTGAFLALDGTFHGDEPIARLTTGGQSFPAAGCAQGSLTAVLPLEGQTATFTIEDTGKRLREIEAVLHAAPAVYANPKDRLRAAVLLAASPAFPNANLTRLTESLAGGMSVAARFNHEPQLDVPEAFPAVGIPSPTWEALEDRLLKLAAAIPRAEALILVRAAKIDTGIELYARLTEAGTGAILAEASAYQETFPERPYEAFGALGGQLARAFDGIHLPRTTGRITGRAGARFTLAFDTPITAPRGTRVLAYRKLSEPDPRTSTAPAPEAMLVATLRLLRHAAATTTAEAEIAESVTDPMTGDMLIVK